MASGEGCEVKRIIFSGTKLGHISVLMGMSQERRRG